MKYQHASIDLESTFQYWISYMPIKHDLSESKEANEFLVEVLAEKPEWVVGQNGERVKHLVTLCGDQLRED